MEDHLADDGVVAVERIAAARVVAIVLAAVFQHVVDAVLQPLEAQGRPPFVALGRVVEDHVEDHLDAGAVQRPDHLLELADLGARFGRHGIAAVRGKETQRIVAPVVRPRRHLAEAVADGKLVDRHQLDGRHAQRLQVRDLLHDAGVRARMLHAAGGGAREAADVQLVDDRFGKVAAQDGGRPANRTRRQSPRTWAGG